MQELDIAALRADTPATSRLVHFNNAGASLSPTPVIDAVVDYLRLEADIGGYEAFGETADQFERFYDSTASLLGCTRDEVAFCTSATDAWWRAFSTVPLASGDRVLTSRAEYSANVVGLIQARAKGIDVVIIDNDDDGQLDLDQLAAELERGAAMVAVTYLSMASGGLHPAAEIGQMAKAAGAFYLLDATQAVGQIALDVNDLGCDFLVFTGRKWLRGPRGTAGLYVRSAILNTLQAPVFVDARFGDWTAPMDYRVPPTALRYELGEVSFAAKLGLGVAIDYALALGLDGIEQRVRRLADALRESLAAVPGVTVRDLGANLTGICTFTVAEHASPDVVGLLRQRGFNTSAGSKEMSRLDLGMRGLDSVIRASIHYYNTEDEIERFVGAVAALR